MGGGGKKDWENCDFDLDGDVDWSDLQTLMANMGAALGAAPAGEAPASYGPAEADSTDEDATEAMPRT